MGAIHFLVQKSLMANGPHRTLTQTTDFMTEFLTGPMEKLFLFLAITGRVLVKINQSLILMLVFISDSFFKTHSKAFVKFQST